MSKNFNKIKPNIKPGIYLPSNEINIIRRNQENNTHEVLEDKKLKRVTSWKKSEKKFKQSLIFNILSFGIVHLISLFYPKFYIKLYCIPWQAKECDFFLVENIYGNLTLCKLKYKKNKNLIIDSNRIKDTNSLSIDNKLKKEYNNMIKHTTYSFEYKSCMYEYDEKNNDIIPIYMNLSEMINSDVYKCLSDGLSNQSLVKLFRERYGKNEFKLNINLIYIHFFRSQIPSLTIVIIIGIIEYICLQNYTIMIIKIFLAIGLFVTQFIIIKFSLVNKFNNEFTLDGKNNVIRVKRNYLLNEKQNKLYSYLNIEDLLPGDIILLKNNEYVPSDCIIINGECLVSECNLTGNLNIHRKIALKNNSELFNYKYSNINILYHGTKILKAFTKTDNYFITALCINIGPNTFKANQLSNLLYIFERKQENYNVYNMFGERKRIILYMILNLFIPTLLSLIYFYFFLPSEYYKSDFFKTHMYKIIIAMICKSLMAVFFLIQNIIILFSLFDLHKLNIICFDKSRLIKSGKINTIIFNKTETLSTNKFELYSYNPVSININKPEQLIFKNYLKEQNKELYKYIFDYYFDKKTIKSIHFSKKVQKEEQYYINNINDNYKKEESKHLAVLLLECLLCCTSIEKYDMEFFGKEIEIEMFKDMKWEIKQKEENINNSHIKIKFCKEYNDYTENKDNNNTIYNGVYYYISEKITDIYPSNYYLLTNNNSYKIQTNKKDGINNNKGKNYSRINTIRSASISSFVNNSILLDIMNSDINSYKIRIYKKFILNGTFDSAVIAYNFLIKELRFMIKGNPEKIITKCKKNTIPKDIEKVISIHRRKGLIILFCAIKILEIDEYNENDDLETYMEDLTFIGFLALKNNIKDNIDRSIMKLKKYNDNFIIISGDNEYNCLSTGFLSGIIENKNIFVLDQENNGKISIKKIYSFKNNKDENEEKEIDKAKKDNISNISGNLRCSKVTTEIKNGHFENNENQLKNLQDFFEDKNYIKNNCIYIPQLKNNLNKLDKISDKDEQKIKNTKNKRKLRQISNEFVGNSEKERIINIKKSITDNSIELIKIDNSLNKRKKTDNSKLTMKKTKIEENIIERDIKLKYLNFMEKYYYHNIFEEYADIKSSIFCISGKLFHYLYMNKSHKGVKNFMDRIISKSKIFFNMSSLDKSDLVEYFRENPNNIVCVIGQCDSDIDSILSSDVGINLKRPKNLNIISSHYYSIKNNINCIKDIIINGKTFVENNLLLEVISFECSILLNAYILCCIIRNVVINEEEMNFLEIEYFLLTTVSFLSKTKETIYLNQKSNLLNFYYYLQFGENITFKVLGIFLFCYLYRGNLEFENHLLDLEFLSYFYVLIMEFLICGILSFSFLSFYKESALSNYYLVAIINIYLIYICFILFLNSSNYSLDIFPYTHFLKNENKMDCYTDKNRLYLFLSLLFDFIGTLLFNSITFIIFKLVLR